MEFNIQVVHMRNCIAVLVVCDVTLFSIKIKVKHTLIPIAACVLETQGSEMRIKSR